MTELLCGVAVLGILMAGLFEGMNGMWQAQKLTINIPTVQQDARQMTITVASALREAPLCTSTDTGCTLNAAVSGASATAVTIYSRPSSALVQTTYGVDTNGNFYSQVGSGSNTTIFTGASMTLTYYKSTTYNSTSLTTYTPTSTTTISLIAVGITTSVTQNGVTGTYTTLVRLRNSPLKTS